MSAPVSNSSEGDGSPSKHDPYAAFRSRNYRLFVSGFAIGTIGFQMQATTVQWEMYQWTKSELSLGGIGLALALPVILLALPGGHLADRFDRRWVCSISLLFTSIAAALMGVVSLLYTNGKITLPVAQWTMYGLLMGSGTAATLGRPSRGALLPQTVGKEHFANAVSWNSSIFELSGMLGMAVGGFIQIWSTSAAYFINAAGALLYSYFIFSLRIEKPKDDTPRATGLKDLFAGVEFVWRKKLLLGAMTLDLFAVLLGGATYLLPVFSQHVLHVDGVWYGILRAAPGIGAMSMAILLAHLPPMKNAGRTMLLAVAGFGAATIVFGLSKSYWLSFAMLILTGVFDNVSVTVRHTLIQLLTPDFMRGRVSAVNQIFIGSSNELGGLESGITARYWGAVRSVVYGGIGTIAVVLACTRIFPQIQKVKRLTDVDAAEPVKTPSDVELKTTEETAKAAAE